MIFEHIYEIGMEDIGRNHLATNKAILTIMEDVAGLHSASVGYGVLDVEKSKSAWVLLDWQVKVIRRPQYRESIRAATWSRGYDRVCAFRDFALYDKNGLCVAMGTSRWLFMNLERRRPLRITEEFASLYQSEMGKMMFDSEMEKIEIPGEEYVLQRSNYEILRRDMDAYGHMHNLSYLEAAYEVIPEKDYFSACFDEIRISYKKEITAVKEVICSIYRIDAGYVVTFSTGNILHAVVEMHS